MIRTANKHKRRVLIQFNLIQPPPSCNPSDRASPTRQLLRTLTCSSSSAPVNHCLTLLVPDPSEWHRFQTSRATDLQTPAVSPLAVRGSHCALSRADRAYRSEQYPGRTFVSWILYLIKLSVILPRVCLHGKPDSRPIRYKSYFPTLVTSSHCCWRNSFG